MYQYLFIQNLQMHLLLKFVGHDGIILKIAQSGIKYL